MSDSDTEMDHAEEQIQTQELKDNIAQNPYDYESHIHLINALRSNGDIEQLRLQREYMSQIFPLDLTLWTHWIQDEMDMEGENVVELHHRALLDYQSSTQVTQILKSMSRCSVISSRHIQMAR
jgi:squamous cell carcinoma antigen recognized by T-cells 3